MLHPPNRLSQGGENVMVAFASSDLNDGAIPAQTLAARQVEPGPERTRLPSVRIMFFCCDRRDPKGRDLPLLKRMNTALTEIECQAKSE